MLWLIGFSMDFLSLYGAGRLFSLAAGVPRISLAAGIGALYDVMAVVLDLRGLAGGVGAMLCAAAMTGIAFGIGGGWRNFFRNCLAVWGCGALLGGCMTLFSTLFGGTLPGGGFADLTAVGAVAVFGFTRLLRRRGGRCYASVRIPYGENVYEGQALCDSGNLLTDPLSGLAVILMTETAARQLVGDEVDGRFRGIPRVDSAVRGGVRIVVRQIEGRSVLLYGFLCRDVTVRLGKRVTRVEAVVCVDHGTPHYGECGVLLPATLMP